MSQRDSVLQIITDVVTSEIRRQSMFGWTPLLYFYCSEICFGLRKKLARSLGVDAKVVKGVWNGPVTSEFQNRAKDETRLLGPYAHNWLEISINNETF